MAQTYNVQIEDSDGNKYCPKPDLLTTKEQLSANTASGKSVDALVVKELNNNLGGNKLVQEGNDFYIVGADSVRKKLGSTLYYLGKTRQNVAGGKPSSTATTFNVSAINGYQNFTVDNFIASANGYGVMSTGNAGYYASVSKSYNANTGVLTVNTPATYFSQISAYTMLIGVDVYLCTGDIVNL